MPTRGHTTDIYLLHMTAKHQLLSVAPYCVYPPTTGGPKRIFYLNRELALNGWDVFQFSGSTKRDQGKRVLGPSLRELQPGYREWKYFNPPLQWITRRMSRHGLPLLSFSLAPKVVFNPRSLRQELASRPFVMLEHPYLYPYVQHRLPPGTLLALNAHNIEFLLFKSMGGNSRTERWGLKRLFDIEKAAFLKAHVSFVCSEEDRDSAIELFGADPARIHVAPNGVDTGSISAPSDAERRAAKEQLGLQGRPVALFIGSNWPPNVQAAREIVRLAGSDKRTQYLIVGGVGAGLDADTRINTGTGAGLPDNVRVTGFVDDISLYLSASDVAVNPMLSGSGTNIKMFEFLAAGLPVVTTPFGARGLNSGNTDAVIPVALDDIPATIRDLMAADERMAKLRKAARRLVEEHFVWTAISRRMSDCLLAGKAELDARAN